jgi:hypothetical protein
MAAGGSPSQLKPGLTSPPCLPHACRRNAFDIRQSDIISTLIGQDRDVVTAFVITTIDQDAANTR